MNKLFIFLLATILVTPVLACEFTNGNGVVPLPQTVRDQLKNTYQHIDVGSEVIETSGRKSAQKVVEIYKKNGNICQMGSWVVLEDGKHYNADAIIPTRESYKDISVGENVLYTYWSDLSFLGVKPSQVKVLGITFDGLFLLEGKGLVHRDFIEKLSEGNCEE